MSALLATSSPHHPFTMILVAVVVVESPLHTSHTLNRAKKDEYVKQK